MASLSNIQMNSVPVDLFIQGQMAAEGIKAAQGYVSSARYIDYDVAFGILGVKKKVQKRVGDKAPIPLWYLWMLPGPGRRGPA